MVWVDAVEADFHVIVAIAGEDPLDIVQKASLMLLGELLPVHVDEVVTVQGEQHRV